MASSLITSWQIEGEKVEAVTDFIFLGFKITADSDWSYEIKSCLLLGRKSMTNLDSVLKSRDITLPALYSQGCGLPSGHVRLWELDHKEGRAPKNWCIWTMVLEKTLESPLDSKEIKPVNLKEINPEYSLAGMLKQARCWSWSCNTLATWCEKPSHWKRPWCWERLRAGGERGEREGDGWMVSLNQWTWVWTSSRKWWRTRKLGVLQSTGSQRVRHNWVTEQQQNKCQ